MESSKITKIITIVLRILFTLLSVGVCAYGVLLYFDLKYIIEYRNFEIAQLDKTVYWPELVNGLYMGVGAVIAIASCCCINMTKNNGPHVASSISLTISVLALASLATLTLVMCDKKTEAYLKDNLMSVLRQSASKQGALERFHDIEEYYHCCGVNNVEDYRGILKYENEKIAGLCCDNNKYVDACKAEAEVRYGCKAVVSSKFYDKYVWGTALCSVTAALGCVDLILSFVLLRIRKKNTTKIRCGTKTTQE